jgi:glycosyltransferase involved in cell wall biosynthesis
VSDTDLVLVDIDDRVALRDAYRRTWVSALPSFGEAFGLVLAESMACGTPVVGSTAGGISEVVDSPLVGETVPYGDDARLADALDRVIDLAARPETPVNCARHAERWDWKAAIGPAHEDLYEAVRDRRSRRGHQGRNRK